MSALQFDTLPVVVHVIHTGTAVGSPDNPSDSLINKMIDLMNDAFTKNGPLYGGANIELAFELANQSPECENTTGIIRINGNSVPDYSSGGITTDTNAYPNSAHELNVKSISRWPNTDYINIWLVNMIDGNPNGLAGYAYFPQYNSALTDGIVLRADAANGSNKTIIHELGHYFSLHHTFGNAWSGCIAETDCTTGGDFVCDTENCMYAGDCNAPINPCSGAPWIIADVQHNYTVLHNYMGYTNCQWMFTEDQKDRMYDALFTFRPGLLSSHALQSSGGNTPVAACVPNAVNGLSMFYGIERVEFGELHIYSNTSAADGNFYIDRTCNQQISVYPGESVFVRITGSFSNYQRIKVFLDYNGDGSYQLPNELILSDSGGVVQNTIVIPTSGFAFCTALRLRVVADHHNAPSPTACMLTGTVTDGVGQVEDYTVIIKHRVVESFVSGDWDVPATWTCNCVPSENDVVIIKSGHLIQVDADMGLIECAKLILEPGAFIDIDSDVFVSGGCY